MKRGLKITLFVVLFLNILLINVVLFLLWEKRNGGLENENKDCSDDCLTLIKEEQDKFLATLNKDEDIEVSPTPTTKVIVQNVSKKNKVTQYIPIPGNGETLSNSWVDLPGTEFYISSQDYPGLIGAYFEANMKLFNGNGLAYLRLFDITTGVEVWGSQISTNSQSFTSISSGEMTIREGTHLYRVQARSLTADTTIFNSGRIKIILEN